MKMISRSRKEGVHSLPPEDMSKAGAKQTTLAAAFDYQKSLKEADPHPVPKYFRLERYLVRPVAAVIARFLFRTSVTPNQLTYFSFFVAILGAFCYLKATPSYFILGGLLAQLSSILDGADGMLARARDQCSEYGAFLDLLLDRITDFLIFGAIITGYYRLSGNLKLFIVGLVGLSLYFLQTTIYYILHIYEKKRKTGQAGEARGLTYIVILFFSLINRLDILIYILIIETCLNVTMKIIRFPRHRQN